MKYIGLFLIFIFFSSIGYIKSRDILLRKKQIILIINFLKAIKISLTFGEKEIWDIFYQLNQNDEFKNLEFIKDIKKDRSFNEAFKKAVDDNIKFLKLTQCEIENLKQISDFLGIVERENQIDNLEVKIKSFEIIIEDNNESWLKKSKLYKSLGVLCGFGVIIFFI